MVGLKALLDSRESPTWMKSLDGTVLYVNPAFCKRFDIHPEDYLGRAERDTDDNPCVSSWAANDRKVIRENIEQTFHELLPDGSMILCRKWPVRIDGETVGVAGEMVNGPGAAE